MKPECEKSEGLQRGLETARQNGWYEGREHERKLIREEIQQLRTQLAKAQAAIKDLLAIDGDPNAKTGEFDTAAGRARRFLNGDTSALDAAMAEARDEGVRSVLLIRCMAHRAVPQLNTKEATGAECPVCAIAEAQKPLAEGLHRLYALRDVNCDAQAKRALEMALAKIEGK